MAINIYGQLTCASGDRLINAEEIKDDAMQEVLGTEESPTQAEINQYLKTAADSAASSANDSTITVKQAGESKGTFTLNASSDKTITVDAGSTVALYTYSTAKSKWGNLQQGEYAMFVYYDTAGYGTISGDEATWLFGSSDSVGISSGDLLCVVKNTVLNLAGTHALRIPLQDAKAASGDFPGADGLETVYDKTQVNKIPTIESDVANALSLIDTSCFRCYSGEYNMNYCGWYGYYMYGTLGRPAGSSDGEYYVLRVANGGTETDDDGNTWVVLEQTAYSCQDAGRVFRRIVKTKDRSAMDTDGNTTWGDWTQLATAADLDTVSQKVSDMLDGAPEAYDTLKEIADYLSTHQDEYAALVELANKKDVTMCVATTSEVETGEETDNTSTRLFLHQGDETKTPVIQITGSGFTSVSAANPTADRMQVVTIATDISEATTEESGLMSASDKEKLDATPTLTVLTQDEYDALETKDEDTVYLIKG